MRSAIVISTGEYWRKYGKVVTVVLLIITAGILPEELSGQTERRSLRIWVDTLDFNLCNVESEDIFFDDWGVWVENAGENDTVLGFRLQDDVITSTMTLRWDTSQVQLEPPYILTPPQTIYGRFAAKVQSVDTMEGILWVTVSPAAGGPIRPVVGTGIPLFYMRGRLKPTGGVIEPPFAGAKPQSFEVQGSLEENIGTKRFLPGFIRVLRDTTPEYIGTLRVTNGDLDTNRRDTIRLYVENIANRRVREVRFVLQADTTGFRFVDTIAIVPGSSEEWQSREVEITSGKITGRFTANADIQVNDSVLLGIIIERTTDSSFKSLLEIQDFGLNEETCLGRLLAESGDVRGEAVPVRDTTDTTDTTMSVVWRNLESGDLTIQIRMRPEENRFTVIPVATSIQSISVYSLTGQCVEYWKQHIKQGEEVVLRMRSELQSGHYFLLLQDSEGNYWNKRFIKQR